MKESGREPAAAPERSPEPEFVPYATDRPVGLDLDEFLPVRPLLFVKICFQF